MKNKERDGRLMCRRIVDRICFCKCSNALKGVDGKIIGYRCRKDLRNPDVIIVAFLFMARFRLLMTGFTFF